MVTKLHVPSTSRNTALSVFAHIEKTGMEARAPQSGQVLLTLRACTRGILPRVHTSQRCYGRQTCATETTNQRLINNNISMRQKTWCFVT